MDELIHQPLRLKIMAALNALRPGTALEFPRLKGLVEATDGNLGAHLATLEKAGYVQVAKDYDGKVPRTRIGLTRSGRRAFADHVAYLRELMDQAGA